MKGSDQSDTAVELRRLGVLYEDMQGDIKRLVESVNGIAKTVSNQPTRAEFDELHDDVKAVKAAIRDTNKDMHLLETRVDRLETAI